MPHSSKAAAGGTLSSPIAGQKTLADGGIWTAGNLQIGDLTGVSPGGIGGTPAPGTLEITASGSNRPTELDVASLVLRLDANIDASAPPVTATLSVSGGSIVKAGTATIQDGSRLSVDSSSAFVSGTSDALSGFILISNTSTLSVLSGTLDGKVYLSGVLEMPELSAAQGDFGTGVELTGSLFGFGQIIEESAAGLPPLVPLPLEIGDASGFSGTIDLASGGLLTLDRGNASKSSVVFSDATIDLKSLPYSGNAPVYNAGTGQLTIDGIAIGVPQGGNSANFHSASDSLGGTFVMQVGGVLPLAISGLVRLADGGSWTTGSILQVGEVNILTSGGSGAAATPGTIELAASQTAQPTMLTAQNVLIGQVRQPASGYPGVTGAIDVTGGSQLTAASMVIRYGASLSADAQSSVVIGTSAPEAGTVLIAPDGQLNAFSGTIDATLDVEGTLLVENFDPPAELTSGILLTKAMTGSGFVEIGAGSGTLLQPAEPVEIGSGANFSGSLSLVQGDHLTVDQGGLPDASITMQGATIDFKGIPFTGHAPQYDAGTGILVVSGATLSVDAGMDISLFRITRDSAGGTEVALACFASGTRIATPMGGVPVQNLRPGDLVLTAFGAARLVRWVGRQRVDLDHHPAPWLVAPVSIVVDAIAPGIPARELFVSPDHGILVDGCLIPARLLRNGASICLARARGVVTYWHVELDSHDLLLAEGLAAESYLDTGNRANFDGEAGVRPLYASFPDRGPSVAGACLPLLQHGPVVAAAAAGLAARARALGWEETDSAGLEVFANSRLLPLERTSSGRWRCEVPGASAVLRLLSRRFVPNDVDPMAGDARPLGIAVADLLFRGDPILPASYGCGWHSPEAAWRWTDGDAWIHLHAGHEPGVLEIQTVSIGASYWVTPAAAETAACRAA